MSASTGLTGHVPCYNVYETADGRYMSLGALEPHFWQHFCETLGRMDLSGRAFDPNAIDDVRAVFRTRTQAEWTELFKATDACCEPILSVEEALNEPQTLARAMLVETMHPEAGRLRQLGAPIKFSDVEPDTNRTAPALGQHTEEILGALGYGAAEISALRERRVIN
jgi:crotonobetainyl-CoA:carnitine CoA-transferase CaiB-like acyl-CoA transferase